MSQNIVELKNVTKAYKVGENYDMPALIKPSSYIITAVSTFIVSLIINLVVLKKLKKINMVSSLKVNE